MDKSTISSSSSYSRLVQDYRQKEKQQSVEPGSDQDTDLKLEREKQKIISQLSQRDAEVRAHEEAHSNVGGKYASAPVYELTEGPDGKEYAIGGHVNIDVSPIEGDPEATIVKADVVEKAALAPVQPSPQDQKVAGEAREMGNEARVELRLVQTEELKSTTEKNESSSENDSGKSEAERSVTSSNREIEAPEDKDKPKSFSFGLSFPQQFVASAFQQQNPAPSRANQLQQKFDDMALSFPPEPTGQHITAYA